MDDAVLEWFDSEDETFHAILLLSAIVSTSEGKLDVKYDMPLNAKALLQEHPSLRDKLKEAWEAKTFRDIRRLSV